MVSWLFISFHHLDILCKLLPWPQYPSSCGAWGTPIYPSRLVFNNFYLWVGLSGLSSQSYTYSSLFSSNTMFILWSQCLLVSVMYTIRVHDSQLSYCLHTRGPHCFMFVCLFYVYGGWDSVIQWVPKNYMLNE